MAETFQDRVRRRVRELGIQPVVAAREAGLERTFIVDILKPDGKKSVRGHSLPKLAQALRTTVEYLTFATDDPEPPARPADRPAPDVDLSQAEPAPPLHRLGGPRTVPVYGTAVGGGSDDGDFRFNGETIDYAPRPPGIINRRDVYVLYVRNDSMAPKFEEGERLYVDPHRSPRPSDYVVVELHGGEHGDPGKGFVKRLVRRTASRLVVAQFNPPKELEFDLREVKSVHRVIPADELLGV
jgi:phage repressor protein C with HTH and peptisase S24 domain